MKTVLAALDRGLAAKPVLMTAQAFAELLEADVRALHVRVNGCAAPRAMAEAAGVPLDIVRGDVKQSLIHASAADDVAAVVIGARGIPTDPRPFGATAQAVATAVRKPVVLVPPEANPPTRIRSVLVPLEGDVSRSLAPQLLIELGRGVGVQLTVLHVLAAHAIPAFTDQPQHEQTAWVREFLARYCPWGIDVVEYESRIGRAEELIPAVAKECGCDLIALGWSQALARGRAAVVRATLERSQVPVVLVPIAGEPDRGHTRSLAAPVAR
jgi:nucleotide-binding universal stress UspA family protein